MVAPAVEAAALVCADMGAVADCNLSIRPQPATSACRRGGWLHTARRVCVVPVCEVGEFDSWKACSDGLEDGRVEHLGHIARRDYLLHKIICV